MKSPTSFGGGYVPLVAGTLRLCGFLGLIALLAPIHLFYLWAKPEKPFLIPQLFHSILLKIIGFKLRVNGEMTKLSPTLFVANHTSYLDIPVLGSLIPAAFVAKAEVRHWPLIGFLASMHHTLFIERRTAAADNHRNYLRERLAMGQNLIVFPEGTSTDGMHVLPFKSSLFSSVEQPLANGMDLAVQPVSIICTELDGLPLTRSLRPMYSWFGDMTLTGHLWNVFKLGHFTVTVTFHPAVMANDFADRKALALYCQQQVARGIEQCLTGRPLAAKPATKPLSVDEPEQLN
jgi:1-acyl-sn-glycerol-3-phosphate acyltransferase